MRTPLSHPPPVTRPPARGIKNLEKGAVSRPAQPLFIKFSLFHVFAFVRAVLVVGRTHSQALQFKEISISKQGKKDVERILLVSFLAFGNPRIPESTCWNSGESTADGDRQIDNGLFILPYLYHQFVKWKSWKYRNPGSHIISWDPRIPSWLMTG